MVGSANWNIWQNVAKSALECFHRGRCCVAHASSHPRSQFGVQLSLCELRKTWLRHLVRASLGAILPMDLFSDLSQLDLFWGCDPVDLDLFWTRSICLERGLFKRVYKKCSFRHCLHVCKRVCKRLVQPRPFLNPPGPKRVFTRYESI